MDHHNVLIVVVMVLALFPNSNGATTSQATLFDQVFADSKLLSGNQNSPCLIPSAADISPQTTQPGASNGTVQGNVVPDVRNHKYQYKNRMPDFLPLRMQLVFKLRNQAQFQSCLQSITDPRSTNYGNFLNISMLQPYLPTPGQRASVAKYLTENGFVVTNGASPLVLKVFGSVGLVTRMFGVGIGFYSKSANSTFYAADSDPTLPINLATLVGAITGLDNYTSIKHSESPCSGPYCPQGTQVGYALTNLYSNGFDGTGQKIAIVDAPGDPDIQSAINTFNVQYGLPSISLDIRYPDGMPSSYDPSWASETAMDVEAVHSVAPGAGIVLLYDSSDIMNAVDYVATNSLAKVVSNSWDYSCARACSDTQLPAGLVSSVDSRLGVDAAQGLTILFASGDEGARPDGTNLGTEFPASDPNVLAIGATNLVLTGSCTNTCTGYGSETGASISGGGYSGFFTEPSWQITNIGTKSGRGVPDVSMLGYSPGFWVYSTASDKCGRGGNSQGWFGCAGTSLSTPLWAGFLAVVLQIRGGSSFGNIGPRIYQLAHSSMYSNDFHDATSGSNEYSATVGWDPVTGWGTPIANNLAFDLTEVTMTVSYSVVGGGSPSPPTFNYFQGGVSKTYTLTTTASPLTVDSGNPWSVSPNPLSGSSSSERWQSSQASSGTATTTTIVFAFYHQFLQTFSYTVVGGGSGYSAPTFTATEFGGSMPQTLTTSASGYWYDSGSTWTLTNPLTGSTSSEQWVTTQSTTGSISSAQTIAFVYQHEYYLTMQASPSGWGTVTPTSGWQNAGASVSIQAIANPGYSFVGWTGSGSGSFSGQGSQSITMNGPITETANFLMSTSISLSVSTFTISVGSSVGLSGSIATNPSSVQVTLSRSIDSGSTWVTFMTVMTDGSGSYSTGWTPPYPASYLLRASWSGNSQFAGSTSSSVSLTVTGTVTPTPTLLLSNPSTASQGQTVTLSITVFNPTSSALNGNVTVQITGPGNYVSFVVIQVQVAASSQVTTYYDWTVPSQAGTYTVNVGLLSTKPGGTDTGTVRPVTGAIQVT